MNEEQVADSFNVLTHHALKEMYDKHNVYYTKDDFEKKKHKSISVIEKYMHTAKGLLSFLPFYFIMFFALSANSQTGRKMVVIGLLVSMWVAFEAKKPVSGTDEEDGGSVIIGLIEKWRLHPQVVKIIGEEMSERLTIHQAINFYYKVLWQTYFQFSLSYSR
mmetsp:Transcript_5538/g.8705  ORF Transcript_5538/g.8705 Transcript_5538/m.8705 type:complete len:162 (-) Transcript_5538:1136-1621(-)